MELLQRLVAVFSGLAFYLIMGLIYVDNIEEWEKETSLYIEQSQYSDLQLDYIKIHPKEQGQLLYMKKDFYAEVKFKKKTSIRIDVDDKGFKEREMNSSAYNKP